jgi:gluconokinase
MKGNEKVENVRILAIDIGSSSTRAAVFDENLNPIESTYAQRSYQMATGPDGRAELDAVQLLQLLTDCISTAVSNVGRVHVVGVSSFWHSLMGVDSHGEPTTRVMMWADTRAAPAVDELKQRLDPDLHHQRTGTRLHSSYPLAKLYWLSHHHPDLFKHTARWVSFAEYIQYKLIGVSGVSVSIASGTGLLDRTRLHWDDAALSVSLVPADKLSPLRDQPVAVPANTRWPQLSGALWVPAIGDGAANNIGSSAVSSNRPALMIGTTGAVRLVVQRPPETLPPRLWQYRIDSNRALLGGALSEGGGVISWMMNALRIPDHEELERIISRTAPDGHGLVVLPYLAGERSPNWNSEASGTIHGLRFDTRPEEIVQATMESIGYSFAAILDDLRPFLKSPVEIIATGNALRLNKTWIQMISDITGYEILLPTRTESSLRGAARFALSKTIGTRSTTDDFSKAQRFSPKSGRHETYRQARKRHNDLYRLLVEQIQIGNKLLERSSDDTASASHNRT